MAGGQLTARRRLMTVEDLVRSNGGTRRHGPFPTRASAAPIFLQRSECITSLMVAILMISPLHIVSVLGRHKRDLPIKLKQAVQPQREAAGRGWRRLAWCRP